MKGIHLIFCIVLFYNPSNGQILEKYSPIHRKIIAGLTNGRDTINVLDSAYRKQGLWITESQSGFWKGSYIDDVKDNKWHHISHDFKDTLVVENYSNGNLLQRDHYFYENRKKMLVSSLNMKPELDTVSYKEYSFTGELSLSEIYAYPPHFFSNCRSYFTGIGEEDFFCVYRMRVINNKQVILINALKPKKNHKSGAGKK